MLKQSLEKPAFIALIFAVLIQIQTSLFAQGDYLGLRVNLADMLLPFTGIYILYSLIKQQSHWPKWNVPYMWLWLGGLALIMTIALFRGIETNGYVSHWALINKYIGFLILLAYFLLGSWLVNNARDSQKTAEIFIVSMILFFNLVVILSLIFTVIHKFSGMPFFAVTDPWEGFMGNRNAFMVLAVLATVFMVCTGDHLLINNHKLRYLWLSFYFLLPFFFIGNASRTGWIIITGLLVFQGLRQKSFFIKVIMPILLLGACCAYLSVTFLHFGSYQVKDQYTNLIKAVNSSEATQIAYSGDQKRFIAVEDGLDLYKKTGSSVFGAGLGTYKPFQTQKRGEFIDVMDFTALWLFVETGPIGLLAFISFFMVCLWTTLNKKNRTEDNKPLLNATATFLICFALMALLHELLYTRILWLVLGMALASNRNT